VLAGLLTALTCTTAQAVMLKGSGDPNYNTTPPTGALLGSGWQYQGQWGSFLGTPIGRQHFIAARHVGGSVGAPFVFNGVTYTTTAYWDDPNGSDLRIWKVDGLFPTWAPLYSSSDELGKPLVLIGRGTQRGDPVILSVVQTNYTTNTYSLKTLNLTKTDAKKLYPNATFSGSTMTVVTSTVTTNNVLKGWKAGAGDGRMRWGENQVYAATTYLVASFDTAGGDNEAFLSSGDSSGAVFIQENAVWKLAGLSYGIEGPFKVTATDPSFYGAILDKSGLYQQPPEDGILRPASFYATRISARLSWITTVLNQ
jgi:hypothetical protein